MPGVDTIWEPNVPNAVLISDDFGRGALALRAHPNDLDQHTVVLRFDLVDYAVLTPPNDEARSHHRLFDLGLRDLMWLGVVRDSSLIAELQPSWSKKSHPRPRPTHFIAPCKECVVEVVAAQVDVFRIDGSTREAALAAIAPENPLQA